MEKVNTWLRVGIAWSVYPGVLVLGFVLQSLLLGIGQPLMVASYGAAVLCSIVITVVELLYPARPEWRGGAREWGNDLIFMGVVQMLLPKVLSLLVVASILEWVSSGPFTPTGFWPHLWPAVAQTALMLVVAEFFRYWMHRAFHQWTPMWSLHAVHHSPHKLYWLNVGRFHPIEKCIQFTVDTLPFILMGVKKEVLFMYLVFYAINGFFQHSNVNMRLGVLNYLISGPELHRWHHSTKIEESNTNYGNNLIVWDLVFGTYFFPRDREVGELGLLNRSYPDSFLAQMKTPFVKGLDKLGVERE